MRAAVGVLAILGAVVPAACTEGDLVAGGEPVVSHVVRKEIPLGMNAQIDVLFVIDDSAAMAPFQAALVQHYRDLIGAIVSSNPGEPPDMHIGVISTALGRGGKLRGERLLIDSPRFGWERTRNYDGTLADNFVQLASVGTDGDSPQSLALIPIALSDGWNPGFLRPDAHLAVIILAASEDASVAVPAEAAAALKALKTDPYKVTVTAALGCDPATQPRLRAFVDAFPERSATVSLCDATLDGLVAPLRQLYKVTLGAPCIDQILKTPHECSSWLVDPLTGHQVGFPECTGPLTDRCWTLVDEPAACAQASSHLMFAAHRFPYPANAILECVTAD